ncbi:MAG: single-stranded DNA-binding protein [Eubacteriales bacterium]|nr:single-stranded DNA-binding protein [Eubacteriales bacterium]
MNKVVLIGRLTRNPDVRYSAGNSMAVARYTLAVDRRFKRDGEANADFISCVSFGKQAEFCEKYLKQGTKVACVGRIQTGSYTNRDGNKVYTTDVVVEEIEFAESKASGDQYQPNNYGQPSGYDRPAMPTNPAPARGGDGFIDVMAGIEEDLPFI